MFAPRLPNLIYFLYSGIKLSGHTGVISQRANSIIFTAIWTQFTTPALSTLGDQWPVILRKIEKYTLYSRTIPNKHLFVHKNVNNVKFN